MLVKVIGIILLIMAVFLIVSILMQSGKSKKLSGTIAGGAETFFGKEKGQAINKRLSTVTNVVAVLFVALVLALFLINAKQTADKNNTSSAADESSVVSDTSDESAASETESAASETESAASEAASETESAASEAASETESAASEAASETESAASEASSEGEVSAE